MRASRVSLKIYPQFSTAILENLPLRNMGDDTDMKSYRCWDGAKKSKRRCKCLDLLFLFFSFSGGLLQQSNALLFASLLS